MASTHVQSVLGPVPVDELGTTLAHEHLLFDLGTYYTPADDDPAGEPSEITLGDLWWLRSRPMNARINLVHQDAEVAVGEVETFLAHGGRTVVDQTTLGIGPRPDALVTIARRTGAHVVAGTGFYIAGSFPDSYLSLDEEALADHLRSELGEGIAGSDVRAGMIGELGISDPVSDFERRVLRAAAIVQAELGVAVSIHTPGGVAGVRAAADAAEAAGLDPSRTSLSHVDNRFGDTVDHHLEMARRGFVLSLDCFGRDCYYPHIATQLPPDAARIRALAGIFEAGFGGQVIVSQDICFRHELVGNGGYGLAHLQRTIRPRLRAAGFDDAALRQVFETNPRRWLAG